MDSNMELRIVRLEAQLRRWRMLTALALVAVAMLVLAAAARWEPSNLGMISLFSKCPLINSLRTISRCWAKTEGPMDIFL